jgi:hypothetical protein
MQVTPDAGCATDATRAPELRPNESPAGVAADVRGDERTSLDELCGDEPRGERGLSSLEERGSGALIGCGEDRIWPLALDKES